jgi:hypothetical protein
MVLVEETNTAQKTYNPAIIIPTLIIIDIIRGIRNLRKKTTIGCITKANNREIVKGIITGEVTFNIAPAPMQAIKATRKKFALPELKLLNEFFIISDYPIKYENFNDNPIIY